MEEFSLYTRQANLLICGIREESKENHAEDEMQTETSEARNVSRSEVLRLFKTNPTQAQLLLIKSEDIL